MKFSTSMQTVGWQPPQKPTRPTAAATGSRPGRRVVKPGAHPVSAHTPLRLHAAAATQAPASRATPWMAATGVAAVAAGVALVLVRQPAPAPHPVVVADTTQVEPSGAQPAGDRMAASPEAEWLQRAPTGAGVTTAVVPDVKPDVAPHVPLNVPPPLVAAAPAEAPRVTPQAVPEVAPPAASPVLAALPDPLDTRITSQVQQALAADASLARLPIAVSTEAGVVRLEGQAPDAPTRDRATQVAAATEGVRAVDNRLAVVASA